MDFLSESTKKERRNLLSTGFAGIIVAQLEIESTDTAWVGVGLKLHSPELPLIAVGGLLATITYFLIKFWSSYLYERSSSEREALTAQILEGKMTMDISKEAEALNDLLRTLIQQRAALQLQQEHEEKRIKGLQDKIDQDDIAHKAVIEVMDQKRRELKELLIGVDGRFDLPPFVTPRPTKLTPARSGAGYDGG